jgi:hypothetical protein
MSLLAGPGNLAETPLAAILLEALNLRASGVLEVGHGGGTSRLWFRDGRPVGAQVFAGFRPLGAMLLQAGIIDVDVLSRSLVRMAETRRPQGEILVEMGAVSAEVVGRTLAEQQAGYFALVAALDEAPFVFDASAAVPDWTRGANVSAVRTIVDALERPQATALVLGALGPAAAGVRLSRGYWDVAATIPWTDAERALVARLERPVATGDLFYATGVAPERARAILAGLLLLGLAAPAALERDHRDDPTGPLAIGLEDVVSGSWPLDGATPAAAHAPRPAAEPSTSPPPAGAAAAAIGRRSDPAEARARRQRLLQQAMRNMGVGPFAARDRAAPPSPSRAPSRPAPPPAAPPSAEARLRESLLAIAPRAQEKDFFVRLGLAETAGRDDVKKAFLGIARQFHPDRFASPELSDLQETVRDFFASVNEAYEVLSDDRKRAEYLARRRGGASPRPEEALARVEFQKGEACLRTRDFARARGFLESAVRVDPRPEYRATLAWAFVSDPACKDRMRARALAAEAAKDASCDRALLVAGIIARDDGDDVAAERHFRAALDANPRNAEAARELRHLEARRSQRR